MVFLILFTLLGTVLCESQLAAITYIDSETCNLDSDVNVELWVSSAPDVCKLTNVVVNTDTSLTMNELTLTKVKSTTSILDTITSTSISPINNVLEVTATKLKTVRLEVKNGDINYLTAGELGTVGQNQKIYLETAGFVQTRGLRITKENELPLILTYDILNKLIIYSKTLPHTSSRL
jgi:hypothetical protein